MCVKRSSSDIPANQLPHLPNIVDVFTKSQNVSEANHMKQISAATALISKKHAKNISLEDQVDLMLSSGTPAEESAAISLQKLQEIVRLVSPAKDEPPRKSRSSPTGSVHSNSSKTKNPTGTAASAPSCILKATTRQINAFKKDSVSASGPPPGLTAPGYLKSRSNSSSSPYKNDSSLVDDCQVFEKDRTETVIPHANLKATTPLRETSVDGLVDDKLRQLGKNLTQSLERHRIDSPEEDSDDEAAELEEMFAAPRTGIDVDFSENVHEVDFKVGTFLLLIFGNTWNAYDHGEIPQMLKKANHLLNWLLLETRHARPNSKSSVLLTSNPSRSLQQPRFQIPDLAF